MSNQIGYYSEQYGTESKDYNFSIGPGTAYFARGGDDSLWISGKTFITLEGKNWWIPSLVNGGKGNDEYNVSYGSATVIADLSASPNDKLRIYDYISNVAALFSIESRHVYMETSWGTAIVLVDGLNENGAIETIEFSDITLSGTPLAIKGLLATYSTMPNQSLKDLEAKGLLKPEAMGLTSAAVKELIDSLSISQFTSESQTLSITSQYLQGSGASTEMKRLASGTKLRISTNTWSDTIDVINVGRSSDTGDTLSSDQIDLTRANQGSVLCGGNGQDFIIGKAGWDILDGGAGNDFIKAGNGRDIITGGLGSDELHGDFGWNTYRSERDGSKDLIAVKSDQFLVNWMNGRSGNNPNGEKCDIIEGLDSFDRIRIIGAATSDLSFSAASAQGISGIGIFAKGFLEALYTGGDLSISQIASMTDGDASPAAMSNQIWSYGSW